MADLPITLILRGVVRIHGPGESVIGNGDSRSDEDAIFDGTSPVKISSILDLYPFTDDNVSVDIRALTDDALAPNLSSLSNLRVVPNGGASAYVGISGNIRARMNRDTMSLRPGRLSHG
jgi:hypothetical protein